MSKGFQSKIGKNPIKQLEYTPLKIIGRFFLAIVAFLWFLAIVVFLWIPIAEVISFFTGNLKEFPAIRIFIGVFWAAIAVPQLFGMCGMLFPSRRRSVRVLREIFTRKEMLKLLENEQFEPTPISSLSVSENWAFLMGRLVPKNYVWKVVNSANVGNTQYSISLITGKSIAILTPKMFYNENMVSNMEIFKATFPNVAFMNLYREFDEKKFTIQKKKKKYLLQNCANTNGLLFPKTKKSYLLQKKAHIN